MENIGGHKKLALKHRYSIVQGLYWMSSCSLAGYVAVYLQYRGLSNTLIGFVVGGAAFCSMVMQPLAAQLVEKIRWLTVKRTIQLIILLIAALFLNMTLMPLPIWGVMLTYICMNTLNYCMPPMTSAMGMEFINQGYYLNFGLSRGIGSICYAICAVVLGRVIDWFTPGILGYVYVGIAFLLFLAVSSMEDLDRINKQAETEQSGSPEALERARRENLRKGSEGRQKSGEESIIRTIAKDPIFICLLISFCMANMGNATVGTYTVNVVRRLGGNTSMLGVANFMSAASEMPVMMLFGYLLKRTNVIRLMKFSSFCYILKPVILLLASNLGMVYLALAMQGFSFGMFTPAAVYYVNRTLAPEKRVKGQAVFSMITSGMATACGNLFGGWIQDTIGLNVMLMLCAGLALAGFLIVVRLPEERYNG